MKIAVIGAGVGGMASACRLARRGVRVEIYEKNGRVGGRLSNFQKDNFRVDTGPTLLLMPHVLRRFFSDIGRNAEDYLKLAKLEPVYRIYFEDGSQIAPSTKTMEMIEEIGRIERNGEAGYSRWLADYRRYYEIAMREFIMKNFDSPLDMLTPRGIISLLSGGALRDLYSKTGDYFSDPRVRIAFSLQSVYIGAAPTRLPAVYGLIPYVEFTEGVWYPKGGLYSIAEALEKLCLELGVRINCGKAVQRIIVKDGSASGLLLSDGTVVEADAVISNADLPYTYLHLISEANRPHFPDSKVRALKKSCSALMFYWGIEGKVGLPHHSFFLPDEYLKTFEDIFDRRVMPQKPGIYVANPCAHDPSLAPAGKSVLYVLVPVPNTASAISWKDEAPKVRKAVLERLSSHGISDLEKRIVMEKVFTPEDWKASFNVEDGATFGLSPSLFQSAGFRPPNKDRRIRNLYFVGASTHPGGGIPIVLMSAELLERRLAKDYGI
ncbi:MAG: phytoene desaturase family protein [Candidatus Micrarchaeota archaeon]|nr:phytoene desaturase family protein [Candidatus Micrarchaeota archaeon]